MSLKKKGKLWKLRGCKVKDVHFNILNVPNSIITFKCMLPIYKENDGLSVDFGSLHWLEYEKSSACSQLSLDLSK